MRFDILYVLVKTRLTTRPWPWKVRVGANSPNRWPTIDSEQKTSINFLPWWTAKVWPTNSGAIVHARAQVLIGVLSPVTFWFITFLINFWSIYGPFLLDLPIISFSLCFDSPVPDNHFSAFTAASGFLAHGYFTPWSLGMLHTHAWTAFTTTMGMAVGMLSSSTNGGTNTH